MHFEDDGALDAAPSDAQVEIIDKTPEESNVLVQKESEESSKDVLEVDDNPPLENLKVPLTTQIRFRGSSRSTRAHQSTILLAETLSSSRTSSRAAEEGNEEHVAKKLRSNPIKKPKINRVKEHVEACIRTVRLGDLEFYTVDEPEADGGDCGANLFTDSRANGQMKAVPECLWVDGNEKPGKPNREVDAVVEHVELNRLIMRESFAVQINQMIGTPRRTSPRDSFVTGV